MSLPLFTCRPIGIIHPPIPIRPKRPVNPSTPQTSPAVWRSFPNSWPGLKAWSALPASG